MPDLPPAPAGRPYLPGADLPQASNGRPGATEMPPALAERPRPANTPAGFRHARSRLLLGRALQ